MTEALDNEKRTPSRPRFAQKRACVIILLALCLACGIMAICVGRYPIDVEDALGILLSWVPGIEGNWSRVESNTVLNVRLPRVVAALLIGAALAEAGAMYQAVFKNPMVSPDLLGVSSGACVGAALGILLGFGSWGIQLLAFCVAVGAVCITASVPKLFSSKSILMLVLSGMVVSGLMSSLLGFLKFIADPDSQLADIVFWTMGSLNGIDGEDLCVFAPVIVISGTVLFLLRWKVNVAALSDEQAHYLGSSAARIRFVVIIFATLMTASAVCLSGTVGWVGLIIPHLSRLLVGTDNRFAIPASICFGGLFMLLTDTFARSVSSMSLPISIVTGVVGAPLFIVLLAAQQRRRSR